MSKAYMISMYKKYDSDMPITADYDNEVEQLCDVCGGCENVGSCMQVQELMACTREIDNMRVGIFN